MSMKIHYENNSDLENMPTEKMEVVHKEQAPTSIDELTPEDAEFLANFSEAKRKKVLFKVDVCMNVAFCNVHDC